MSGAVDPPAGLVAMLATVEGHTPPHGRARWLHVGPDTYTALTRHVTAGQDPGDPPAVPTTLHGCRIVVYVNATMPAGGWRVVSDSGVTLASGTVDTPEEP